MNPLKVGIIGAGARTIVFCKFINQNPDKFKLVAIADKKTDKAHFFNHSFNFKARIYENFNCLIEDDDIEAVFVSTPDFLHVEPTIAALRANKYVYLEKPLATSLDDCDKIIEASNSSNSICYMGFNLRHSPVHEKIYDLINQGRLGKVTTIEANEWYYGGKTYFRRWNRLRKYGGGLWLTKASHDFDLITWIAGGIPKTIFATSSLSHYKPIENAGPRCRDCSFKNSCQDYYDINKPIEDNEFDELWRQLQLKMDQNGDMSPDLCLYNSDKDTFDNGMAVIEYDNDIRATYAVNVLAARTTRQISIIGTTAMIEADMEEGKVRLTERHSENTEVFDLTSKISGTHGGADYKILTDFYDVCRKGGQPRSGLREGKLAVQMSLAARESADKNLPIYF